VLFEWEKRNKMEHHADGNVPLHSTGDQKTDYSRWRLMDEQGRQSWRYLESDEERADWPQTTFEKHFLGLDTASRNQILSLLSTV